MHVACGQITWNASRRPDVERRRSEEEVLAEIAQAGYDGAPASLSAASSPAAMVDLYAHYGLQPAPGYFGGTFWEPEQREQILEQARRHASFMREVGCSELYVAAGGFDYVTRRGKTRMQIAGHVRPEDALSDDEFERFADVLNVFGELTLREGVRSCFHNHVGTPIETEAEIVRLLSLVDHAVVFLGPDTGHLAWAGVDPVDFCRQRMEHIETLHIKDIDADVCERGRVAEWEYRTFERNGIFTELGEGSVDLPTLFTLLRSAEFDGWIIVETDVTQQPSALESARISRQYLRSIGI